MMSSSLSVPGRSVKSRFSWRVSVRLAMTAFATAMIEARER